MVIDEWSPFLPTRVDPKISILSEGGKEEEEDEEEVDQMLGGEWLDCSALFCLLCRCCFHRMNESGFCLMPLYIYTSVAKCAPEMEGAYATGWHFCCC